MENGRERKEAAREIGQKTVKEEWIRTAALIGADGVGRLSQAHVAVFGIGGVGGHVCEALARAGIGHLDLIDRDVVSLSNINRQIVALHSTVGRPKVDVMAERIHDINPDCRVKSHRLFYLPETADQFDLTQFDYVVDAVDTVSAKIELATRCHEAGVPLISAMGAGNKRYPEYFRITDLTKTDTDPLARILRRELKKRGIYHLKVVWSDEIPETAHMPEPEKTDFSPNPASDCPSGTHESPKSHAPGSLSFVPSVMGLLMAGEIIRTLSVPIPSD